MAIDFCGPPKPIESTATLIIGRQNPEAVSKAVGNCASSCLLTGSKTGITCGVNRITYAQEKGELAGTCSGFIKDGEVAGPCQDSEYLRNYLTEIVIQLENQRPARAEELVERSPLVSHSKPRRKH
jgi:hypothetical protein